MNIDQMNKNCEMVAELLKVLSHPQRLMILCHLYEAEKTVGELCSLCSLSQSQTSQFLNRMKREGLVKSTKNGNFTYYELADQRISKLMKSLHGIFGN